MIIRAFLFCKSFNRLTQPSVTFEMIYAIDSRPYGTYDMDFLYDMDLILLNLEKDLMCNKQFLAKQLDFK